MRVRLSDLWSWRGAIDRGPYVLLGAGLALIKYNIDRFLTSSLTGQSWYPWQYWIPGDVFGIVSRSPERARIFGILIALALPFIWTGVVLTIRRLRAARLPVWLVMLFFVPFVNLLFFAILSILPTRTGETKLLTARRRRPYFDRLIPEHPIGNAALAIVVTAVGGGALAILSTLGLKAYGWGLFIGIPFALGFVSALLHTWHESRSVGSCMLVALLSVGLLSGILIALAYEGLICIMMAAPIAAVLAIAGAVVGYALQLHGTPTGRAIVGLLAALPVLMGAEAAAPPEPPMIEVRTTIVVDAPPDRVWKHVVSFAELPPPDDWLFRAGVAHPLRAEIYGHGVGAERHCVFSTGAFVEPIEVWDEPRLLKFSVTSQPPAMEEWTLYPGVRPPHVDGYLQSHGGQFLLTPLPGGRTRLEGTTWYTHKIWPTVYWTLWSDWTIHRIHRRVLVHVKRLAEQD